MKKNKRRKRSAQSSCDSECSQPEEVTVRMKTVCFGRNKIDWHRILLCNSLLVNNVFFFVPSPLKFLEVVTDVSQLLWMLCLSPHFPRIKKKVGKNPGCRHFSLGFSLAAISVGGANFNRSRQCLQQLRQTSQLLLLAKASFSVQPSFTLRRF